MINCRPTIEAVNLFFSKIRCAASHSTLNVPDSAIANPSAGMGLSVSHYVALDGKLYQFNQAYSATVLVDALAVDQRHQVLQTEHEIRLDLAEAQSVNHPPTSD